MINNAYAQEVATAVAGGSSMTGTIIQLVFIFGFFYFLLLRPQQKKMKAHEKMLSEIKKGDNVITTGGIVGKVVATKEDDLEVEIAKGTVITVKRSFISNLAN